MTGFPLLHPLPLPLRKEPRSPELVEFLARHRERAAPIHHWLVEI